MNKLKPKRLQKGDTIGLITPGSSVPKERFEASVLKLENQGFKVHYLDSVLSNTGFLAGSDKERIEELHYMFRNPDIDAIICVRGGYGCTRILPFIDYDLIRNNPKILIGYSDVTALLQGIYKEAGLIGFHGPLGVSDFNKYTLKHFQGILMTPSPNYIIDNLINRVEKDTEFKCFTINEGIAEGELAGGNLCLISSLIGTPYEIDFTNKIAFIEDVGEAPYRIDRMLTQLLQTKSFPNAKGILLGVFNGCERDGEKYTEKNSFSLSEVLVERLQSLNIPTFYGFSFGHIDNICTLPVGIKASLNTKVETLTLLEEAVI